MIESPKTAFGGVAAEPASRQPWPRVARPVGKRPTCTRFAEMQSKTFPRATRCRLSARKPPLLTGVAVSENLVCGFFSAPQNLVSFNRSRTVSNMNSERNRLNPEITDIAAVRRVVRQVNDGPEGFGLPHQELEVVVLGLARHFGLALDPVAPDTAGQAQ